MTRVDPLQQQSFKKFAYDWEEADRSIRCGFLMIYSWFGNYDDFDISPYCRKV